jgi:hypothetical protein
MYQPFMPNFIKCFRKVTEYKTAADDTSFSYSNRDELQIKTVIDHDLKELDEWSKKWLMTFNSDKTEIMLFSNTPQLSHTSQAYSKIGLI